MRGKPERIQNTLPKSVRSRPCKECRPPHPKSGYFNARWQGYILTKHTEAFCITNLFLRSRSQSVYSRGRSFQAYTVFIMYMPYNKMFKSALMLFFNSIRASEVHQNKTKCISIMTTGKGKI